MFQIENDFELFVHSVNTAFFIKTGVSKQKKGLYYLDSGSSLHFTNNVDYLVKKSSKRLKVLTADGIILTQGSYEMIILLKDINTNEVHELKIEAHLLTELDRNLLSISLLENIGVYPYFREGYVLIERDAFSLKIKIMRDEKRLYYIEEEDDENLLLLTSQKEHCFLSTVPTILVNDTDDFPSNVSNFNCVSMHESNLEVENTSFFSQTVMKNNTGGQIKHLVFGHASDLYIQKLGLVLHSNNNKKFSSHEFDCKGCMAKLTRPSFKGISTRERSVIPGQTAHTDTLEAGVIGCIKGYLYMIHFTDDCTSFTVVYCLRTLTAEEILECFKKYIAFVKAVTGNDVTCLYSDNAKVFSKSMFSEYCVDSKIFQDHSGPYVHENMGIAERVWLTLERSSNAMLITASLSYNKWPFSMMHSCFLKNILPTRAKQYKTPFQLFFKYDFPLYNQLRIFGALCYYKVSEASAALKKNLKFHEAIFLGYTPEQTSTFHLKNCIVYDINLQKIVVTGLIVKVIELLDSRGVLIRKDVNTPFINRELASSSDQDIVIPQQIENMETDVIPLEASAVQLYEKFTSIPVLHVTPKNANIELGNYSQMHLQIANNFKILDCDVFIEKDDENHQITYAVICVEIRSDYSTWFKAFDLLNDHYKWTINKLVDFELNSYYPLFQAASVNYKPSSKNKVKVFEGVITAFDFTEENGQYFLLNLKLGGSMSVRPQDFVTRGNVETMLLLMKTFDYHLNFSDFSNHIERHMRNERHIPEKKFLVSNNNCKLFYQNYTENSWKCTSDPFSISKIDLTTSFSFQLLKLDVWFIYNVLERVINAMFLCDGSNNPIHFFLLPVWPKEHFFSLLEKHFDQVHLFKKGDRIFEHLSTALVREKLGKTEFFNWCLYRTKPISHFLEKEFAFVAHVMKNKHVIPINVNVKFKRSDNIYKILEQLPDYVGIPSSKRPRSISEALTLPDAKLHLLGYIKEVEKLVDMDFADVVSEVEGMNPLDCFNLFKVKMFLDGIVNEYKSRVVIRGDLQTKDVDFFDTHSPVANQESVRLVIAIVVQKRLNAFHIDFTSAYIYGTLKETIYMRMPDGFVQYEEDGVTEKIFKLKRSIYGLKQAGRVWRQLLKGLLIEFGFSQTTQDPCVFIYDKNGLYCILSTYVDDAPGGCSDKKILDMLVNFFKTKEIDMKYGELKQLLGLKIDVSPNKITISQPEYIEQVCKAFLKYDHQIMTSSKIRVPMMKEFVDMMKISKDEKVAEELRLAFAGLIGSALWINRTTRPDISYAVNVLSRFTSCPTLRHMRAALHLLKYLYNTRNEVILTYEYQENQKDTTLYTFIDADHCNSKDTGLSTSGYVIYFMGCLIHWGSKKQKNVALSTVAAEYFALTDGLLETMNVKQILQSIGIDQSTPSLVFDDSTGAIFDAENEVLNKTTKSFNTKYHFVRELIERGEIKLLYTPSSLNYGDMGTKPLQFPLFKQLLTFILEPFVISNYLRKIEEFKSKFK